MPPSRNGIPVLEFMSRATRMVLASEIGAAGGGLMKLTALSLAAVAVFIGSANAQLPDILTGTVSIELRTVATGLTSPVELVMPNDGTNRLFIIEQPGR